MLLSSHRPFYLAALTVIVGLAGIVLYQEYQKAQNQNAITIYTGAGSVKIFVEYAETTEKQEKGLMNRASLKSNAGMLFVFTDEKRRGFWMKNVLIPLDLIFMDSKGKINEITTLQPCVAEDCPVYDSKEAAKYVLEINAGFAGKNRIMEGDILEISGF